MIYPIDPTGISPHNRIVDEVQVIMPPGQVTDATFFVPRVNPFFRLGLVIQHGARTLIENVDYQLVFRSVALSEHFERELFGGVMFVNRYFEGTVKISYQVLGGDFQNDDYELLERLARIVGAIRWVTYDQLIGVPSNFPPAYHLHDIETDLVDMGDVVDVVEKIAFELGRAPASMTEINARITSHLSHENAHTKRQVGLGNLENLAIATDVDLSQGVRKYVTADNLKKYLPQIIRENVPPPVVTPPVIINPGENADTLERIRVLRQDVTNFNNTLTQNGLTDTQWRVTHLQTNRDPHPQYATDADFNGLLNTINGILTRLKEAERKLAIPATPTPTPTPTPPPTTTPSSPVPGVPSQLIAFWVFPTPGSDRGYVSSIGGPGVPGNEAITVVNFSITKLAEYINQGGDRVIVNHYHLTMAEFTTTFDMDLSRVTCKDAYNNTVPITKVSTRRWRVNITAPSRGGEPAKTPLSFSIR